MRPQGGRELVLTPQKARGNEQARKNPSSAALAGGQAMSMKTERGTKRTCQSASCGARFYDLNRDPIACPICGTVYEMMTTTAVGAIAAPAAEKARRPAAKKPDFEGAAPATAPEVEGDDALADIETDDEAISDDEDDETFLEPEEEDGGDVSGIIGGPVPEGDEEP